MTKPKIGDIFELQTSSGFAYFQYSHKDPLMGDLIRVLPGFFDSRPVDFGDLVRAPSQFVTFVPLASFLKTGVCSVVGNSPVPSGETKFPLFRAGAVNPKTRKVETWWLWDGQKEWKVGLLSAEQRRLPIRGIWNDTLLVERIVSGWRPENDMT